jgi:hypothetical protein
MKRPLTMASILPALCCLAAWAAPESPLPAPFPEERYKEISAHSPFAVATATAAATAAPTPGFAAQLYADGVAHVGDVDFVVIKSRDPDQQNVLFLPVGGTSTDGIKVERVNWSAEMGKSTVEVSKGNEKATLEFDEAAMKTATQSAPPPIPNVPGGLRMPTFPGGRPPGFQVGPGFNGYFPPGAGPGGPNLPQSIYNQRRRIRGLIQSGQ